MIVRVFDTGLMFIYLIRGDIIHKLNYFAGGMHIFHLSDWLSP